MEGGHEWKKGNKGRKGWGRTDDAKMATPVVPYGRCFEQVNLVLLLIDA